MTQSADFERSVVYDATRCELGEGPLWHPLRQQLFWFDIPGKCLYSREQGRLRRWPFDEMVSAAAWVDHDQLLISGASAIYLLNVETNDYQVVTPFEADNPITRSNDGRADPYGGFWISSMGYNAETGAGKIYRFFNGELMELFKDITIPNAICFSPDHAWAYFTDTTTQIINRVALDAEGWPVGAPELFIDLRESNENPDGAVIDSHGCMWLAKWGASQVTRYSPQGEFMSSVHVEASQASCPAFGGESLETLFITSATVGLESSQLSDGATFACEVGIKGQAEHRVLF